MSDTINRTHFLQLRQLFNPQGLLDPACLREAEATPEAVTERVARIPYNWINKRIYDDDVLPGRIRSERMRLFDFFAAPRDAKPNGYLIVVRPDEALRERYCPNSRNPAEIENIAVFRPGSGQGRKRLHTALARLFADGHDAVYLNTSETNFPTLPRFYRAAGMLDLGQDSVPDFNRRQRGAGLVAAR